MVEPLQTRYVKGTSVSLRAQPEPEYRLVRWEGDLPVGLENAPILELKMDRDRQIKAIFGRLSEQGKSSILLIH
jgi:hypothetical protein